MVTILETRKIVSNETFTGNDVRELRKKHSLSRRKLGEFLNVAAVTIEKWEQAGDQPIRPKYYDALGKIAGYSAGAGIVGAIAAPMALAALPAVSILGAGAWMASKFWSDTEIDRIEESLIALRRLTPEERKTLFQLYEKMNS